MWNDITYYFKSSPKRLEVASLFLLLGLSVKDTGKVYCQDIEVPQKKIADTLGLDRRVVTETVKDILAQDTLRAVFSALQPRAFFRDAAPSMGWGVVEIEASSESVGIVAGVAALVAQENISIRQVVADDPSLNPQPKLTLITEQKIPPRLLEEILKVRGVRKVSIY